MKTLTFFGFGRKYIKWIGILLNGFKACINHANNLSTFFNILRGCRQGDPIASGLFELAVEVLCIRLCNSKIIKGYQIGGWEFFLKSLYADDVTVFLHYSADNLRNAISLEIY